MQRSDPGSAQKPPQELCGINTDARNSHSNERDAEVKRNWMQNPHQKTAREGGCSSLGGRGGHEQAFLLSQS